MQISKLFYLIVSIISFMVIMVQLLILSPSEENLFEIVGQINHDPTYIITIYYSAFISLASLCCLIFMQAVWVKFTKVVVKNDSTLESVLHDLKQNDKKVKISRFGDLFIVCFILGSVLILAHTMWSNWTSFGVYSYKILFNVVLLSSMIIISTTFLYLSYRK